MDTESNDVFSSDGDLKLIEAVSDHCERFFGEIETVFHEKVSQYVHVDILRFHPDPKTDLVTFVTCGMAELPMNAPEGEHRADYQFAELVLQMPAGLVKEYGTPFGWPFAVLNMLARYPHQYNTWLWHGHTVQIQDPVIPSDSQFSVAMLWPSFLLPEGFDELLLPDGRNIAFLTLGFATEEERKFKGEYSQKAMFQELKKRGRSLEEFLIFSPSRTCLFSNSKPKWKFWKR